MVLSPQTLNSLKPKQPYVKCLNRVNSFRQSLYRNSDRGGERDNDLYNGALLWKFLDRVVPAATDISIQTEKEAAFLEKVILKEAVQNMNKWLIIQLNSQLSEQYPR